MTPIEQAKALAAYWRERADKLAGDPDTITKARETADLLEQIIDDLRRM